jgi:dGTPase
VGATQEVFGDGPLRRYDADLVVPALTRARCALLKGISLRYIMRRRGMEPWYDQQRRILTDLVQVLAERAPDGLDPVFAPLWKDAPDDAAKLRVVIDQVASLTDPAAVAWHHRLLPGEFAQP